MSNFIIGAINNATISLGNGDKLSVKNLSVKIDGKLLIENKEVSAKIENGVLIINSK